jgi:hypothetical protein
LNSKILLNDRRPPGNAGRLGKGEKNGISALLAAVKIMCSPLLFEHEKLRHHVFAVEELQRIVYASTNKAPIFQGPSLMDINMEWIMKCLDFFRHFMMNKEASALSDAIKELPALQKPTAWQEPLKKGCVPLGRHWKGTYSFLDPKHQKKLRALPDDEYHDAYYNDHNIDEGKIQVFRFKHSGFISLTGHA